MTEFELNLSSKGVESLLLWMKNGQCCNRYRRIVKSCPIAIDGSRVHGFPSRDFDVEVINMFRGASLKTNSDTSI